MAENHALTEIEKRTGFLVYRTARGMKKMLDFELNKYSVSSSQYTVLNTLMEDDGLSLSEIGKRVFIDKPAVTGIADRMEKDGLVERRRTSQDRRVIQLFMTKKGRALAEKTEGIQKPQEFGNHGNLETTAAEQNSKEGGGGAPQGHSIIQNNCVSTKDDC